MSHMLYEVNKKFIVRKNKKNIKIDKRSKLVRKIGHLLYVITYSRLMHEICDFLIKIQNWYIK